MKKITRSLAQQEASRRNGRNGGRPKGIPILNVKTGIIESHYLPWILNEINRNRPADWIPYTRKDWKTGWQVYVESERHYKLVEGGE